MKFPLFFLSLGTWYLCDASAWHFNDYIFSNYSEPKEKAKEPDKENNSLPGSRHDASIVNRGENASHDDIQRSCQQLIDDINAKRKRDTDLLNGTIFFSLALIFSSIFLNTWFQSVKWVLAS